MEFPFQKYQGTGNDFVIVQESDLSRPMTITEIKAICARSFGVGSDGLMIIGSSGVADYKLEFFNPDGSQSFCGNGARCSVAFALAHGLFHERCVFEAFDGLHEGIVMEDEIAIAMREVHSAQLYSDGFYCHTGSPHLMVGVDDLNEMDIVSRGRKLRYDDRFSPGGTNVNFLQSINGRWHMRTYERGVEQETLSCGTGATAAGLFIMDQSTQVLNQVELQTLGGKLTILAQKTGPFQFKSVYLKGSVKHVFNGVWQTLED